MGAHCGQMYCGVKTSYNYMAFSVVRLPEDDKNLLRLPNSRRTKQNVASPNDKFWVGNADVWIVFQLVN